jgi:hypothetical protein
MTYGRESTHDTGSFLPDSPATLMLGDVQGLRLGHCARRILLLSPGPDDAPQVLLPERDGRASAESHRRALQRLADIGLVELSLKTEQVQIKREKEGGRVQWDGKAGLYRAGETYQIPVRRTVRKRAVKLTPIGALLVDRLRTALETGGRIRWTSIVGYGALGDE